MSDYDYSKLSFQKLQELARDQAKIIEAYQQRLDSIYEFIEDNGSACFVRNDVLDLLSKVAVKYPIILGKDKR